MRFYALTILLSCSLRGGDRHFTASALDERRVPPCGDLWSVARDGGARRLTTAGAGNRPHFRRTQVGGLNGDTNGQTDVFVWRPREASTAADLHPRGFGGGLDARRQGTSLRGDAYRVRELYTLALDGVVPEPLRLAHGGGGIVLAGRNAHRVLPLVRFQSGSVSGGTTTAIRIAQLSDASCGGVPRENSNDFNPCGWTRGVLPSDRSGRFTLFAYDTRNRKVTQAIANAGWTSIGVGGAGPSLTSSSSDPPVRSETQTGGPCDYAGGRPARGAARIVKAAGRIDWPAFRRAARGRCSRLEARFHGSRRKGMCATDGHAGNAERDPGGPPSEVDGVFSDEGGEYQLHIREHTAREKCGRSG